MSWPVPVTLRGRFVTIEPLRVDHHDAIVDFIKDGELWNLWYTRIPRPEKVADDIAHRFKLHAKGSMLPFVVIDNARDKIVGVTSYMNIEAEHRRVEIGATWYAASAQRTPVNTECKRLLLAHAFEELDCIAVEFRTAFVNHQSRRAIERLGAKLDGILRSHQLSANGTLRDTCVYSIIACEWPTVRAHLDWQMQKPR